MKEFDDFCLSAKKPISSCRDLYKHFIGRHRVIPVYLTPKFEIEFNHNMSKLENLEKIISEFVNCIENNKLMLNNPYILDFYLKVQEIEHE